MFVDAVGLDPAKVETSCVLRKLMILKMQDGVPYDNFQHALRAEHDWAIVAETLYYGCCCRSRRSAAPACCTAPADHKLSSPAARWSVMLFATLLTLMVGTLLIPTVGQTQACDRSRECLSNCHTDWPGAGACNGVQANPSVDSLNLKSWYIYPNASTTGFRTCWNYVAGAPPPSTIDQLKEAPCVWSCLPPGVSAVSSSGSDRRPPCANGTAPVNLMCSVASTLTACASSDSPNTIIVNALVTFILAGVAPIVVKAILKYDWCGSSCMRQCCGVTMVIVLTLANFIWLGVIIQSLVTTVRDGKQLLQLYVPSQLSAVVVRIGVLTIQWAYTQKLSGLQFWSNRDKPFDDSPSPTVRDPGSPPPPTEKPTNRPDTFWAYPPPLLQPQPDTNGSTSPHDIQVSVVQPDPQQQQQQQHPVVQPVPPQRVSYGQPQQQVSYVNQQPAAVYGQPVVFVAQPGHNVHVVTPTHYSTTGQR